MTAFTSLVVDSLFVGETENIGNPVTPEEKAYGRSLPKRLIPDFPIHGYQYYDYRVDVANTTFVNYQDNKQREAGALSWLLFTSSGVTTENTIKGAKYVNAKPVHFPKYDCRFDNDNRGGSAYRTLAIHDLDGTTTGMGNSYVLLHDGEFDSPATDDTCKIQPTWNASVCVGDVGRLNLAAGGGGRGRSWRWRPVALVVPVPALLVLPRQVRAPVVLLRALLPVLVQVPLARAELDRALAVPPPLPSRPSSLSRNGKDFKLTGTQATVRSGIEIKVKTERPQLNLSLAEMNKDSWIIFELPGFASAASGTKQDSMDALRKASVTSYFKDKDALWVKLVVPRDPALPILPTVSQASIAVSRNAPDAAPQVASR